MHHRLKTFQNLLRLLVILVACCSPLAAAEPRTVDFARDVLPILRKACFECHDTKLQKGDLRLDRLDDLRREELLIPGSADDSELVRRISLPRDDREIMPARGEPLSPDQIATIRDWIAQGARLPEKLDDTKHWAYVAPQRPELPGVRRHDWAKTSLDHFVLARLEREGLEPSPAADHETLVRRLYLDLVGIPPSPAEVDRFLADTSDAAYERLVEELLNCPQYGERWARHWLDLARYADSYGFQRDNLWDVWAYRDWVIRALNSDMPFDRFTIEQIAGDLLPDATEEQKIATGFYRCGPTNVEAGSLPEETRIEQVIDRVNTTATVWLGTTLECAQCHDHKYDPFTQRDYYRLLAYLNNTEAEAERTNPKVPSSIQFRGPSMSISNTERDAKRLEFERRLSELQTQKSRRRDELADELQEWAADFRDRAASLPQATTFEIVEFDSTGTTDSEERLPDGSVRVVGGDPPDVDEYTVQARVQTGEIRAIRLDVLADDSLPGKGTSRTSEPNPTFVLSEFEAAVEEGQSARPLKFASARADAAEAKFEVARAIDGKATTGWAVASQAGKSCWATFILKEPLAAPEGVSLKFRLVQKAGDSRTIGRLKLSAISGDPTAATLSTEVIAALAKPAAEWTAAERRCLLETCAADDAAMLALGKQTSKMERELAAAAPDTTLVMIEIDQPRATAIFQRGDYRAPGEPVEPGTPVILHASPSGPQNRLALARWLVDRRNPLVARVVVNRLWAELFGRGLVSTVEDFGIKGDAPSHPELLDWLAVEFMEGADHSFALQRAAGGVVSAGSVETLAGSATPPAPPLPRAGNGGWSIKRLLRQIVLSAAYRQSSIAAPQLLARDDANVLLARGPRFRMDAEMVRDNALAISGLLSLKQFGPSIRPYQPADIWRKVGGTGYKYEVDPGEEKYRRGIYVVLKRGTPYPSFMNFDGTPRLACTVKRSRTNTPMQALTLLNDPVYVEAAGALAARILAEAPTANLDDRLVYGFRVCTARRPEKSELEVLRKLFEQQAAIHSNEATASANNPAWLAVATALLNLHETITKE